jgi:hypothetical protein
MISKKLACLLLIAGVACSQAAAAEFCTRDEATDVLSCRYTDNNGRPHDAMMTISLTREGWSLMLAVFLNEEWLMMEGDASVRFKDDSVFELDYLTTHRDLTEQGRLMEAAFFEVEEDLLRKIGNSKGSMYFNVPAEKGDLELKFWTKRFKDMDAFLAETKATVGLD